MSRPAAFPLRFTIVVGMRQDRYYLIHNPSLEGAGVVVGSLSKILLFLHHQLTN